MNARWGVVSLLMLALAAPLLPVHLASAADAVVGTGSPASCTEAAFASALATAHVGGGGTVSFNCGSSATIVLGHEHFVQGGANIIIDGADKVTLKADGNRHLQITNPGTRLELRHITLLGGSAGTGGAVYNADGELTVVGANFEFNHAEYEGGAIFNAPGLPLVIRNSRFTMNSAEEIGGAVANHGHLSVRDTEFVENKALMGGAISGSVAYSPGPSSEAIVTTSFVSNRTTLHGGAIFTLGDLIVDDSEFIANVAHECGGAIYVDRLEKERITEITGSRFVGNRVDFSGPGSTIAYGGAIAALGGSFLETIIFDLGIYETEFLDNTAQGAGGAAFVSNGRLDLGDSTVAGNVAETQAGGGFLIQGASPRIYGSTIAGNTALESGGGFYIGGHKYLEFNMIESTISGNRAEKGAGIYMSRVGSGTTQNSTISGNSGSEQGGAIYLTDSHYRLNFTTITATKADSAAIFVAKGSSLELFATIVADQRLGRDCHVEGVLFTKGFNLDSDGSCSLDASLEDIIGGNADLKPLGDYGGPTLTHLPGASSDAVDHMVKLEYCPPTDQRGASRPFGDACDIGAVELHN